MSIASYDAHRRRMAQLAILKAASTQRAEEIGRLSVNWHAVMFGAAMALYIGGLIWTLSWLVPEVVEFVR